MKISNHSRAIEGEVMKNKVQRTINYLMKIKIQELKDKENY